MQLFGLAELDLLFWISLLVLGIGILLPKKYGYPVAALGWVLFGLRWFCSVPDFYFRESNIIYSALGLLALPLTLYGAYILTRFRRESLLVVSRCVAIGGLFFALFAFVPWLGDPLRGVTTDLALALLHALGFPAVKEGFDLIGLNNIALSEIVLTCTAIQSVAIFVGVVGSVKVEARRWLLALLVSAPVIYILNLLRITFAVAAWGSQWFQIMPGTVAQWSGKPAEYASYFWAHNILAEAGSLLALMGISYAVLQIMPELWYYLQDVFSLVEAGNIRKLLRGEEVPVIAPVRVPVK